MEDNLVKLLYESKTDYNNIKNILLIHNDISNIETIKISCNEFTFPIIYDNNSSKNELNNFLFKNFKNLDRIAYIFHDSDNILFLNNEKFFNNNDLNR